MYVTHKIIRLKTTVVLSEIQLPKKKPLFWIHKYDRIKRHVFHQRLTDYVIRALKRVVICLHGDVKTLGVTAALLIVTLFCWRMHTRLQPLQRQAIQLTPPRPQVDASCLSISTSACEHLPVASIRGSREGSCIQITFNFIRMNSWHSQERAGELCDAAAAWRGWAPWAPEVLLCNWSRTHDSFFHCYQRHISSGGNTSGYFLLAQFAWIRWNDGCDSSNVGSNRGILLVLKYLHW